MKKLKIFIIGEEDYTFECLKLTLELGHEVTGCISASPVISKYCQDERIFCFKDISECDLTQFSSDYYIVLSHTWYEKSYILSQQPTQWIRHIPQTTFTPATWYTYQDNKIVQVYYDTQDITERYHYLLMDLSREAIHYEQIEPFNHIVTLFENQVERHPYSIAVQVEDDSYTYKELNDAANKIAHALQKNSLQTNPYVILTSERCFESIAAILGIWKTGGCYVPMQPKLPEERKQAILDLTQAHIILNREKIEEILSSSTNDVFPSRDPYDLAYLIFTSGSTGDPKGVMINHMSLSDRLLWFKNTFSINEKDRMFHHTNMGFDVSIEEIFLPLISGGQVILAPENIHSKVETIGMLINRYQITLIEFVPSLLNVFLESNDLSKCSSLRYVISGGEALHNELLQKFHSNSSIPLLNIYGPTETTINASYYICQPNVAHHSRYVPIGYPVGNAEFYVLDSDGQAIKENESGELYIGGIGLTKGYLTKNPSAQKGFIYLSDGKKLYKTGDLVRYGENNALEFLGRVDRQVKLRGYRIELEEIESVLHHYPNVNQVAVFVHGEENQKQLIAYLSCSKNSDLYQDNQFQVKLSYHCAQFLPNYMIPNSFHLLEFLPITQNDKINYTDLQILFLEERKKIPTALFQNYSELEKKVQECWSRVLSTVVEREDNFFDLGGNSLTAVQAVALLNKNHFSIQVGDIFQYPTVKELVSAYQEKNKTSEVINTILPAPREQRLPLSFAQQRLWYLYQLEGTASSAYNIAMAFRLEGTLNFDYLAQSINLLKKRHEILRTVFKSEEGKPWQVILPYTPISLIVENIEENTLEDALIEETHFPFDIEQGPLARYRLYQTTLHTHVLVITMHNIITDGWSESIIIDEINKIYNALHANEVEQLFDLPFQYADFSFWQKRYYTQDSLSDKIKYWTNKLSGYSELSLKDANIEMHSSSRETSSDDIKFFIDDSILIKQLYSFAQKVHTTPYVLLVTVLNLLLSHRSNQEDIVIGSGMAGRNLPELQKLIGFFVNTVVLRNDISGNPTFITLIERVKETCIEAHQYQDVPFEMIVDGLLLEREEGKNPIFQVLFILQKTGDDTQFNLQNIKSDGILLKRKSSTFDITFNVALSDNKLWGDIQYNGKLFSNDYIESLLNDFKVILKYMLSYPERTIQSSFSQLNQGIDNLISKWNDTKNDFPLEKVHEVIKRHAIHSPEKTAIVYQNQTITYSLLEKRAVALAHYLNQFSPRIVGISIERNIDYVVSVLATLKTGSVFLPLDPAYPRDRLQHYLSNSACDVILCESDNPHLSCFETFSKIILIDSIKDTLLDNSISDCYTTNDSCYVLYTSGSTGQPKGVVINHDSIMNLLYSIQSHLNFMSSDKFLSVTSSNFDIFYLEMFLPLISGGTCILADKLTVTEKTSFHNLIQVTQPTVIQATPSFWSMMIENSVSLFNEIQVLVGGEVLTSALANKLLNTFKKVWNVYGPTETTIWSTIKQITDAENITIGKALANTQCYVLNPYLNSVPLHVPGELYIAGKGLSMGYINNRQLTEQAFVMHPTENIKLYRTGDYVRYLKNGELEYVGRRDQQVKVRGHRIELLEIEACLLRYKGIRDVAVIFNKELLIAFYIVDHDHNSLVNLSALQAHILNHLPAHCLPNKWIKLDMLPQTLNGKTDRKQLQNRDITEMHSIAQHITPLNQTHYRLINIWSHVLNVDTQVISANDSFFMIGGHSLLIPQVISMINKDFCSRITIRDFIQHPTINKLSLLVENNEIQMIS